MYYSDMDQQLSSFIGVRVDIRWLISFFVTKYEKWIGLWRLTLGGEHPPLGEHGKNYINVRVFEVEHKSEPDFRLSQSSCIDSTHENSD